MNRSIHFDIKIEFNEIYHDRTGKYLLCVFNK